MTRQLIPGRVRGKKVKKKDKQKLWDAGESGLCNY
jgi:hypothetical protein